MQDQNTPFSYLEALEWLFAQMPNYQIDGIKAYKPGLENIIKLCNYFGNPQKKLKTIHIGGTNGKGSTSNMVASILQEQGYTVGLYTSPHLIDFTERIKINGENCSEEYVLKFIHLLKKIPKDIRPSFFEFTTIMAFCYFLEKKVDFAIIEVGLGGRLDSTNIITPLVAAITNVQLDHQDILGETVAEIATEKAGIIKENIPIISGSDDEIVKEIIQGKALQNHAPFIDATLLEKEIKTDLDGNYQQKNAKVTYEIIQQLKNLGISISESAIDAGMQNVQRNTHFMGRWFVFSEKPLVICDTGHNPAGLKMVFSQLSSYKENKHIILGFVEGKKVEDVMPFLTKENRYYFVKPNINRGKSPEDYKDLLENSGISYRVFPSLQQAYLSVNENIKENEMIFIGGSNFVVGEFLQKNLPKKK